MLVNSEPEYKTNSSNSIIRAPVAFPRLIGPLPVFSCSVHSLYAFKLTSPLASELEWNEKSSTLFSANLVHNSISLEQRYYFAHTLDQYRLLPRKWYFNGPLRAPPRGFVSVRGSSQGNLGFAVGMKAPVYSHKYFDLICTIKMGGTTNVKSLNNTRPFIGFSLSTE
jgi:hypothetical protein